MQIVTVKTQLETTKIITFKMRIIMLKARMALEGLEELVVSSNSLQVFSLTIDQKECQLTKIKDKTI